MTKVVLTQRALRGIKQIDVYSVDTFGQNVADEYMADMDRAFDLLSESPDLLRVQPEISGRLRFYRVRHHFLVCDVIEGQIYVLAVMHGSMDLPNRIGELEPQLIQEVTLMHRRYLQQE